MKKAIIVIDRTKTHFRASVIGGLRHFPMYHVRDEQLRENVALELRAQGFQVMQFVDHS